MEFHIARVFRDRFQLRDLLFSYTGNVIFANVAASRHLAQQMNDARVAMGGPTAQEDPTSVVHAGQLFAMGLIDELSHAVVERYRKQQDPDVLKDALRWFGERVGADNVDALLLSFTERFPNVAVYNGKLTAKEWLAGSTDGMSHREAALEELLLLWLANQNPAYKPCRTGCNVGAAIAHQHGTADVESVLFCCAQNHAGRRLAAIGIQFVFAHAVFRMKRREIDGIQTCIVRSQFGLDMFHQGVEVGFGVHAATYTGLICNDDGHEPQRLCGLKQWDDARNKAAILWLPQVMNFLVDHAIAIQKQCRPQSLHPLSLHGLRRALVVVFAFREPALSVQE